ncbi:chitooligosaccharide deacetylase [Adhaeribacter aerolatus]|uniref:Chitooligosaccharide deacetylase n=1 Tax=Adhaeribacter aerolatus TaxID=670289 RepID=A0A512AUN0_9BACT|nr:polysaccharide deacetylase family protein [Adhaeribacter aerolatus]GEO03383.1 chitooligosaccharide deacetylase [Adhaeribacter aerolatus]
MMETKQSIFLYLPSFIKIHSIPLRIFLLTLFIQAGSFTFAQTNAPTFSWPKGKQVAVSLSFDDARPSQVDKGTAVLDEYNVKATFYLVPSTVEQRLPGWKKAVASGHEMGNHSLNHPCTGNFPWSRQKALEDYTLEKMDSELTEANKRLQQLLGVKPEVFAYPCGQTFVGRGVNTKSYIPVVAKLFSSGRGWLDEGPNDPTFCDMAQLTGIEMDGKDFEQILPLLEEAKKTGKWVVLAGHEMGESGSQTTRLSMLRKLMVYAQNPANGIWLAPVGTVGKYVQQQKSKASN